MSGAGVVKLLEFYNYKVSGGWALFIAIFGLAVVPNLAGYILVRIYAKGAYAKLPSESIPDRGSGFKLNRSNFPNHQDLLLKSPVFLGLFLDIDRYSPLLLSDSQRTSCKLNPKQEKLKSTSENDWT